LKVDWLLRFLNPYKAEGGLVRILARSCFQVTRAAAKCWRGTGRTVSCCNCSGELGGPKSKDEKRCGARGRHSGPPLSPWTQCNIGRIGASTLALQGLAFPWVAISPRTWNGSDRPCVFSIFERKRYKNASTSGPYFGGRNLTPKTGVMRQRNSRAK